MLLQVELARHKEEDKAEKRFGKGFFGRGMKAAAGAWAAGQERRAERQEIKSAIAKRVKQGLLTRSEMHLHNGIIVQAEIIVLYLTMPLFMVEMVTQGFFSVWDFKRLK